MSNHQIKKSFIIQNGKKVPFFKIPTGVSGLTAEAKVAQRLGEKDTEYDRDISKNDVEEYFNSGEINSAEVIDFMSSNAEFIGMELFDKLND